MVHSGTALIDPYNFFEKIKLSSGMRVADFGCGRTGHFVFPAAKIVGEEGIVYAIDIVKNILESIKSMARSEGYENVQAVWSDIELCGKTPIPAKSLDACFFVNVLSQLKKPSEAIKEATRLLKENGFLVIIEWTRKLGSLGPSSEQQILPVSMEEMLKQAKLNLVEEKDLNSYHYYVISQKIL